MKKQLNVLVIDDDPGRAALLKQALSDEGYRVLARLDSSELDADRVSELKPDMIIVDVDSPDRDILENMSLVNQNSPRPVVMFAEQGDQQTIEKAIRAGVSAYIVDGLDQSRIKSILDVASARFREFQALKSELTQAKSELEDRKLVDKAKVLVMKHNKCTEDQAYKAMRNMAMDQQKSLGETAKHIISVLELMS